MRLFLRRSYQWDTRKPTTVGLTSDVVDDDTKAELKSIENNEKEIEERFYRELEFGTAGMRGIIGAGTKQNQYT